MSNNRIEKVALVGAGGNSGKHMAEHLLKTGKHQVSAITRQDSKTPLPDGLNVVKVDYNDHSSLVKALKGYDALIITMGVSAPRDQQEKLIRAAADAEIPWILPNEWGPDSANLDMVNGMLFSHLQTTRELITELGKSSWIAVSCGFWYEWSTSIPDAFGVDFANRTVTWYDEGEARMNISTWPQVGRAVAALLSLPVKADGPCLDNFKNGWVYPTSFLFNQKEIFESVQRVTNTTAKDWTIKKEPSGERYNKALEELKSTGARTAFARVMYTRGFFPDEPQNVEKHKQIHNDILGIQKENVDEHTKTAMHLAEGMAKFMSETI